MARRCALCGKGPTFTLKRSHSMKATKVKKYPNLQRTKFQGKKILVCTSCLKSLYKSE